MSEHEGECSFLFQPLDDDGKPQDRDHCRHCGKARSRALAVSEEYLRTVLRDALGFAQALANSGDPEALGSVARYELALLRLPDAPQVDWPVSDESKGVVTFRATRITMIDAIGDALPASGRRRRRKYPLAVPDLADAIMAVLPVVEPASLKAVTEAERIIAARDSEIEGLRDTARAKDATLAEAEARAAEALEVASSAEAEATDLRERLAEVLGVRDAAVAAQSERAGRAEAVLHDIDLILDGVPGLSQSHGDDQAADVRELAGKYLKLADDYVTLRKALDPHGISDEEFEQAKASVTARWGRIPPSLQRVIDLGGRFGLAIEHGNEDGLIVADRGDIEARDASFAAMTDALKRLAVRGTMASTKRQQIASDGLRAAQGHAEVAP